MATLKEQKEEINSLKNQIRELKSEISEFQEKEAEADPVDLPDKVWGISIFNKIFKLVEIAYDPETLKAVVVDIDKKDNGNVLQALGYQAKENNTYIIRKSQGRDVKKGKE